LHCILSKYRSSGRSELSAKYWRKIESKGRKERSVKFTARKTRQAMLCDNWSYSPCNLDILDYSWAPQTQEQIVQLNRLLDVESRMRLIRRALQPLTIRRRKSHNKNPEETRIVSGDENKLKACQIEIFYLSKKLSSKKLRTQSNRLFYAIACFEHGKRKYA